MTNEREQLKLEHTTVNTVTCNKSDLFRAKSYLLEILADTKDSYDMTRFVQLSSCYTDLVSEFETYADECTEDQHKDIIPWLSEFALQIAKDFEALEKFINTDHPAYVEEYVKSDDYASEYSYLCNEGQWREEDLDKWITDHLQENYLGYYRKCEDIDSLLSLDALFDGFKCYLKNSIGYEVDTSDGYFATHSKNFIEIDSFPVGEHEDQIELSSLRDSIDSDLSDLELTALLEILDVKVQGKDHPYFYLHVDCSEICHHFGWTTDTLASALDDYLKSEVIPGNLNCKVKVIGANGKPCVETTGDCSCCGATGKNTEDFEPMERFRIFRAGFSDSDGVFYARLCGDLLGNGCIYEVAYKQSDYTDLITELSGDDLDAAQADHEDLIAYKQDIDGDE